MTKAFMQNCPNTTSWANGDFTNILGQGSRTTTEANMQADCTEGATFTGLRAGVISGNSGTGTWRFRDAGVNGNNVASGSGTGVFEDTTNSDVLSAGDDFGVAYTDTGTNSVMAWLACNVEFASGYGCFTAATSGGVVQDRASETRYHPLAGIIDADGEGTEANVGWMVRGYTTFEALQIRVSANARTNDSVFRNRINGGNGTAVITFAAGATGLVVDDGLADAITDGHTIDVSMTLDTGVEDLTLTIVGATLKSSNTKQDVFGCGTTPRTASSTAHYFTLAGAPNSLTTLTEAQARCKIGFAGTASNLRFHTSARTYTGNSTMKLYVNGSAVITLTVNGGDGPGWSENASDTFAFDADDELSIEWDEGTSGSMTIEMWGLTLAPTVAAAGQPTAKRFGGVRFASIRGNGVW